MEERLIHQPSTSASTFKWNVEAQIDGRKVDIPLGSHNRPYIPYFPDFENWLQSELAYALFLKESVETGKTSATSVLDLMRRWSTNMHNKYKEEIAMRTEESILYYDFKIRTYLEIGNADLKLCKKYVDRLCELKYTYPLLSRNPRVVETVYYLTKLKADHICKRITPQDMRTVEDIKIKTNRAIRRMRKVYGVPDTMSLKEFFEKGLNHFKKLRNLRRKFKYKVKGVN